MVSLPIVFLFLLLPINLALPTFKQTKGEGFVKEMVLAEEEVPMVEDISTEIKEEEIKEIKEEVDQEEIEEEVEEDVEEVEEWGSLRYRWRPKAVVESPARQTFTERSIFFAVQDCSLCCKLQV